MLLGIDLGTASLKALLLSADGRVVSEASCSYTISAPERGAAEIDPEVWWRAAGQAVNKVVAGRGKEVQAIGLSGQMHGVVPCEADGLPARPALLWADARASRSLSEFRTLVGEEEARLANPLAPGMAGPLLLWLRRQEPEAWARVQAVPQPKDWLRWRMTGRLLAEPSDASGTLLWDMPADDWLTPLAARLGLANGALAPVVASSAPAGELTDAAAHHLGLPAGLPVAAGAADTAAAALGSGLLAEGEAQLTIGTGAQIVAPIRVATGNPERGVHLYRDTGEGWYLLAAIQNAGLALERVRKLLGLEWDEFYQEAFASPPGARGLTFLPHLTGERTPHLDPHARGAWLGIGLHHQRGDLARAAFEGVAFALREGLDALRSTGLRAPRLRLAGGGSLDPRWRSLLADALGTPLDAIDLSAVSARGAAILAGLATGVYSHPVDALAQLPPPRTVAAPTTCPELEDAFVSFTQAYTATRRQGEHRTRPEEEPK